MDFDSGKNYKLLNLLTKDSKYDLTASENDKLFDGITVSLLNNDGKVAETTTKNGGISATYTFLYKP